MKKCLAIVAVCLMAAPAMAGDVPDGALSALGLGGMQTMTDAQGMQVRGKASEAVVSGTSLVFGQLVADLPTGTNFVVGSDVNHYYATAVSATDDAVAQGDSGSAIQLTLGPIDFDTGTFSGNFTGALVGGAGGPVGGGFANAFGSMLGNFPPNGMIPF